MNGKRILSLAAVCVGCISVICGCAALEPQQEKKVAESAFVTPVFDIPKMDKITVDGDASDWADGGFRVEVLAEADGAVQDPARFDVRFRLGWDQRGLLVLIHGHDEDFTEGDTENDLWEKDAVELFMLDKQGGKEMIQAIVAPGMDPNHPELRYCLYDRRKDENLKKVKPALTAARTRLDDNSYVMEILLPWENVGIKPQPGTELALQVYADDHAEGRPQFHAMWHPGTSTIRNSAHAHRIRLAESASPPVLSAARAYYDGGQCTRVVVVGVPEMPGDVLTALVDGKEVARGKLTRNGPRCIAGLRAPFPGIDCNWTAIELQVDGKTIDTVELPDTETTRLDVIPRLPFVFDSFCFTGTKFPDGDFENPAEAQNVLGPYAVNIAYHDAECNPVASADKPGRYGAVAEITPLNGPVIKRFFTLFRAAGRIDWGDVAFQAPTESAQENESRTGRFGSRSGTPADRARSILTDRLVHSEYGAILLAWRQEVEPGSEITEYSRPESCNARWIQELKRKTGNAVSLEYFVHLPEGAEGSPEKKWPTILWLHGGGWPKDELPHNAVVEYGKTHKDFPFIVVAPYCPRYSNWSGIAPELSDLVDEITSKYPVDKDKFYLTGLSMGGGGSWRLATERPDLFAAVVPICGYGDPRDVERIKEVPIWCFHATNDAVVPFKRSEDMVRPLEELGGRVRFTVNETEGHSVWRVVYKMDELYSWLLEQSLGKPAQPRFTAPNMDE